jgi:hypothetical protein
MGVMVDVGVMVGVGVTEGVEVKVGVKVCVMIGVGVNVGPSNLPEAQEVRMRVKAGNIQRYFLCMD